MKIKQIYDYLTNLYPLDQAESFDQGKIGLQFGSFDIDIDKVLCCLDATNQAIDYAIENGIKLIITHHPFMFQPMINLKYNSPFGKKLLKVLDNRISIMTFHTNYDVGNDGMNDTLANKLGFKNIRMLTENVGPDSLIRVGNIEPQSAHIFLETVKKIFNQKALRVAGNINKEISTVAIVGGSGSSEFYNALHSGADIFITGQVPHHLGIEAIDNDFILVEVSHAVEFYGVESLYKKLKKEFKDIEWFIKADDADPFEFF